MRPINITLFLALCAAEIADIVTTNAALGRGMTELNPLFAMFQAYLGSLWWLPKMSALLVGIPALLLTDLRRSILAASSLVVAIMWIPAVNNALVLMGLHSPFRDLVP